jgi:hypothetical protein
VTKAEAFAHAGDHVVIAAFAALVRPGPGGWSRATERCERVLGFGTTVVTSSGTHLGWLDAATGALLHEADAGVTSSWIEYLQRIDDDRFFVMGYDEGRLQLWSNRRRARIAEHRVDHRHDDGRFARPYGVFVHGPSRRVLVSYWDHVIDVFSVAADTFEREHQLVLHAPWSTCS